MTVAFQIVTPGNVGASRASLRRRLATAVLAAATAVPLAALAQHNHGDAAATKAPASAAPAATPLPAGIVTVDNAWTRATVGAQRSTGAFLGLTSTQPLKLVGVESAAANIVEIHEMALVDNVMRMRQIDAINLDPGQRVELKPGGFHVMMIDLRNPVKVGDTVAMTLVFEDDKGQRRTLPINATARPLTDTGKDAAADHGANDHGKRATSR